MQPPTLIAEIGCNHLGDMEIAKRFIDVAGSFCEIENVKFQKRSNRDLLPPDQYDAPHPVPQNSYGDTYGEHREYLEFDMDQHKELMDYCTDRDMVYATSIWDAMSLRDVVTLGPTYLKIPSATNTNFELLEETCRTFGGKIHVSMGMTTRDEETQIMDLFRDHGRSGDVVLYACTSGYPIQASEACLMEIPRLLEAYGDEVEAIGYSGHHNGIAIDSVAFTLGATYIERHFTLDRTWKGTDHAASLEPDGMRRLQRNLAQAAAALEPKSSEILPIEEAQRVKLKWGAAAAS
ncbi:MAG: N-acetylneuraminate synthase family protein [Acidimicrobiia bacterium]|nr:N-acetylneuraminate synthase family protein [Acidimicrobiia bacterium]